MEESGRAGQGIALAKLAREGEGERRPLADHLKIDIGLIETTNGGYGSEGSTHRRGCSDTSHVRAPRYRRLQARGGGSGGGFARR